MTDRPVLRRQELVFGPVTDWELEIGLAYARDPKGKYRAELDCDLLRVLFNTATERREEEVILPLLVARVVQEGIPFKNKEEKPKYEAYKGAVMKIFSERSARSSSAQAKKRKSAEETRRTGKKRRRKHPQDTKGQLILL